MEPEQTDKIPLLGQHLLLPQAAEAAAVIQQIMEIMVEVDQKIFSDEIKQLRSFEEKIKKEIESVLGVFVRVKLVEPKTIERSEGKAKRVIDKRKI